MGSQMQSSTRHTFWSSFSVFFLATNKKRIEEFEVFFYSVCLFSIIEGFVGHVMVDPFHCIYFDALSKLKFIIAYEMNWSAIWIWDGPKKIVLFLNWCFRCIICKVFSLRRERRFFFFIEPTFPSISFSLFSFDCYCYAFEWSLHEIKSEFMYRKMFSGIMLFGLFGFGLVLSSAHAIPFHTESTNIFISMFNKTMLSFWQQKKTNFWFGFFLSLYIQILFLSPCLFDVKYVFNGKFGDVHKICQLFSIAPWNSCWQRAHK